jgi:meso-butanediol dehydrogenase / (S,S)-butanediol dehydrogenase / diacetyl reductase
LAGVAERLGDRCLVHKVDLTVAEEVGWVLSETALRFRRVDVLVNNAGTTEIGDYLSQTRLLANAVLPLMVKAEKGAIVNVATLGSLDGWGLAFYYAALSVISSLTRSLAMEFGAKGIRTNAVAPSVTAAELSTLNLNELPLHIRGPLERIPMGRGAQPYEVAGAVAFLASAEAGMVNGINLPVDGGLSALFDFTPFNQ